MRIRKFKEKDARRVYEIISRCDKEITSKYYSSSLIDALVKSFDEKKLIKNNRGRICFVVIKGRKVVGHISFEGNEIKKLHVDPDFIGKGIGKKLLKKILKYSKKKGMKKIIVKSTILAEDFYSKFGFMRKKIVYEDILGEKFKLILMEKKLK